MKTVFVLFFSLFITSISAQDIPIEGQKRIFFPHPMDTSWRMSIGFISTTMPRDITEELHFRVPAVDLHVIKKVSNQFFLDGRINSQILQNMITIGPRWTKKLDDRFSIAIGNDIGYWFGSINQKSIKTTGHGWQNIPNASIGYRFNKGILVTLRAESLMNFGIKTYVNKIEVPTDYRLFSGSAYSVIIEQPFSGKKSMTLGFRAIYTDYFWQTWTLYESYDRNIFFPQLIVGLIL